MLLVSVIKECFSIASAVMCLLPISFFVSDAAAWQSHNPNSVTTAYLLDLSYYHSL